MSKAPNEGDLKAAESAAMRGELDLAGWNREGMGLFQKGLVTIDPLAPTGTTPFQLTDAGKNLARKLREARQP